MKVKVFMSVELFCTYTGLVKTALEFNCFNMIISHTQFAFRNSQTAVPVDRKTFVIAVAASDVNEFQYNIFKC